MTDDVSTRGLVDSDLGPLRRFIGILVSAPTEAKFYGEGEKKRPYTEVSLNVRDIEIKEAIEPYSFPTYSIIMNKSNRRKSQWGYFSDGKPDDKVIGFNNIADMQYSKEQLDPGNPNYVPPSKRFNLKDAYGKRVGFVLSDGEEGRPKPPDLFDGRANEGKGGDVPRPSWTVYYIEGIGTAGGQGFSPLDKAMELLDGKTLNQFNSAALASEIVRGDPQLLSSIGLPLSAPNSFANVMVSSGKFTLDSTTQVYKRVK